MFDKEAIESIQEGAAIQQANNALGMALHEGNAVVALPENYQQHDLEKFLPKRRRARGNMVTDVLESFSEYSKAHKEEGAAVFVDTDSLKAVAVLNLGTPEAPGHADNAAKLVPTKTAAYAALTMHATGSQLKQATAAEFLEDWAECMQFFNDDGAITPPKAIAALRKLSIESMRKLESSEQSLSASKSAFESVQATSADPIPTTIYFTCKPYADLAERQFVLRLGVMTGGDKPTITLRIIKAEEHAEEMATELAKLIRASFYEIGNEGIPVLLGSYSKN
jgi:uncharacterized protein YfdQ (DUF2303 family)